MDAATLSKAMGGSLSMARYQALLPAFNAAMVQANINSVERAAHWCAQLGHESGGLRWMEEIASGSAYEGRRDLGNTVRGDGVRFKGRGPIQVTGRHNYTQVSKWAHNRGLVPTATYFVDNPPQLASDRYGFIGPVWYWTVARSNLNALCDRGDVVGVTRAINGGTNGLSDRRSRYNRCKGLGRALLPSAAEAKKAANVYVSDRALDYYNVEPDATLLTKSYTPGRKGKTINCIYRHHMAGNLNLTQCVRMWDQKGTSAHFTVNSTGGVGQAVYDSNTAWATGNTEGNERGLSIEHANVTGQVRGNDSDRGSWNMTDATIIGGARLAAALCLYYKLGRPEYGRNIKDHRDVRQTFCPGHLARGGMYHDKWMNEAKSFYDKLVARSVYPDGTDKKKKVEDDMFSEDDRAMVRDILIQLTGDHKVNSFPGFDLNALAATAKKKRATGKGLTMMETIAASWDEERLTGDQLNGAGRKDGGRTFNGWSVADVLATARARQFRGLTLAQMVVVGFYGTEADVAAVKAQIAQEEK